MLIDHIGEVFISSYPYVSPFKFIGKISFVIMSYMLVEGFHHTRSRLKYFSRLSVFGFISYYPYALTFGDWGVLNNIMFTFSLGILMLSILEKYCKGFFLAEILIVSATSIFSINMDWEVLGPILIYLFWKLKNKPIVSSLILVLLGFLSLFYSGSKDLSMYISVLGILLGGVILSARKMSDEEKPSKLQKYFFYIFYPAHILFLGLAN